MFAQALVGCANTNNPHFNVLLSRQSELVELVRKLSDEMANALACSGRLMVIVAAAKAGRFALALQLIEELDKEDLAALLLLLQQYGIDSDLIAKVQEALNALDRTRSQQLGG